MHQKKSKLVYSFYIIGIFLFPGFTFSSNAQNYNYAYSCDGYNQDRDDIAASAMTLALFDRAGLADRIVHFHFNTNFGGKPTHAEEHRKSALQTAVLFGIIEEENSDEKFFDVSRSEQEKTDAINHLAEQIRKANRKEPLMIFAAGGVQLPYLALKKAIGDGIYPASGRNNRCIYGGNQGLFHEKRKLKT